MASEYVIKIIEKIVFAQKLIKQLSPDAQDESRVLRSLVSLLPCQVHTSGGDGCLGFGVGERGAFPCGCALLPTKLLPLVRYGCWKTIENFPTKALSQKLLPKCAWVYDKTSHGENEHLFEYFLISLLESILECDDQSAALASSPDLQVASINDLERWLLVQRLFFSDFHAAFSWPILRTSFLNFRAEGFDAVIERMQGCSLVVLNFARLRLAVSGPDLPAFEYFVNEVSKTNSGLIVFSEQSLFREEGGDRGYEIDFERPMRRSYRDNQNRWRLESTKSSQRGEVCVEDLMSAGSWDRLVELLSKGQRVLNSLLAASV